MTREELIIELKKRCSFWLNNKTISKKHALECLCGILEKEEFQSSLPSNIDEAARKAYPPMSRISEPHGVISADNKSHYLGDVNEENRVAFKTGAEWMAGQGLGERCIGHYDAEYGEVMTPWNFRVKLKDGEECLVIRKKQ